MSHPTPPQWSKSSRCKSRLARAHSSQFRRVPRVSDNFGNRDSRLGILVQHLLEQVAAIGRERRRKLRLVVADHLEYRNQISAHEGTLAVEIDVERHLGVQSKSAREYTCMPGKNRPGILSPIGAVFVSNGRCATSASQPLQRKCR
jgi:hypothetical protein